MEGGNSCNGLYWEAPAERGNFIRFGYIGITLVEVSSSETQGQSVWSGEKARRKVLNTGGLFPPCLEKNE